MMSELSKNSKIDNREYIDQVKEVINGKIYVIKNSSYAHAYIVSELRDNFSFYFHDRKIECRVYSEGLNVYLDEEDDDTYVIPDVVIVCGENKIIGNGYKGVPELIVEVLSDKTRSKDKGLKFRLYERVGVKEYWIVDPRSKTVEQYILKDGWYFLELLILINKDDIEDGENEERSIMESFVFKDMKVDFNDILKNI